MPDGKDILLGPVKRQLEEIIEGQRKLQGEIFGRLLEPTDAVFDLLEQSSGTFRKQSEALEQASEALGETARLMQRQAELFEKTIKLMREPTELAKSAAGVDKSRKRTTKKTKKKSS
jgi:hypothetical protein